ncbi:hypothetical protein [Halochromatium roseum]|uniref:hypothetical protein n=1 Tax=Halochromatium roseum TaxID=391920 RepID=UPI0019136B69|nr:hypothetical protein [Halochromatium roseum]
MMDRIRSILEQLEQTRDDLLALSDDIWLSIDHNDLTLVTRNTANFTLSGVKLLNPFSS